jgi:hypothetical protein
MLVIAATFGSWGWLLSARLTRPGQLFEWLTRVFPFERRESNAIWACSTCVAGFQSAIACALLYYSDYLSLILVIPSIVLSMAIATKLDA